ncbi:MAG: hypothetical protein LBC67_07945 [Spirochaetales bacterium]|nr:hypothetical protein [Spirochaetales bacterium]
MSKAHRGAGLRSQTSSGRGVCPLCKRSGIKVVHEVASGDKKLMLCKQCKAAVASGKKQLEAAV